MNNAIRLVFLVLTAAGCASTHYAYQPAQAGRVTETASQPATYSIVTDTGQGQIQVASLGVEKKPLTPEGVEVLMLRIRMTLFNQGSSSPGEPAAPWHVSTRAQTTTLSDGKILVPVYADSATGGLPDLVIDTGQKRTLELFYPLPDDIKDEKKLPSFAFNWKLRTPKRTLASSTTFDRVELTPLNRGAYTTLYPWGATYEPRGNLTGAAR